MPRGGADWYVLNWFALRLCMQPSGLEVLSWSTHNPPVAPLQAWVSALSKAFPVHVLWSLTPCDAHKNKCKEPLRESLSFLTRAHCTLWSSARIHKNTDVHGTFVVPPPATCVSFSFLPFKPTCGTRGPGIGRREQRKTARNVLWFPSPTCHDPSLFPHCV